MEENGFDYQINLTIEDIRLIHHSVQETLKFWPGSPARNADEQEHLWYLRDSFFRIMMDYNFNKN
jgi:hypothetical protein